MKPAIALSLAAALLTWGVASAAPVGDALDRPAVSVRAPDRVVLLSAGQAGARIVAVGERGIVALSDDGGQRWRQASTPTAVTLTTVRFADDKRGWAVGHGGVVLSTEDGGQTWTRRLDGRRLARIVLAAARAQGDAKALQDAERLAREGPDKPLLDLLLLGEQRLLAVGAYGLALASDDGGLTWASWTPRLPNPRGLHLYAARLRGDTVVLAGEQGLVLVSTNRGRSFERIETPYKGSFFTAELMGEQDIVLAGLRGNVLRSRDGGGSWSVLPAAMPVSITASVLDGEGRLLMANQAGFILALNGDRIVPLNASPLPPLNGLLIRPGAALLALSVQGAHALPQNHGNPK